MAILDNIIAFWKLEEASGTRVDEVGANNLADNNTVTQAVGKIGNAAQFTAANSEFLSIADNVDLSAGDIDFFFQAWVFLDSKSDFRDILGKWQADTSNREYLLHYNVTADRFRFLASGDGSGGQTTVVDADQLGSPAISTWYHIICWHDSVANTISIVIDNGTADTSAHTAGVFDGNSDFRIGRSVNGVGGLQHFDGRIDAVGFWKRVPTAADRTKLWNNGNGLEHPFKFGSPGVYTYAGQNVSFGITMPANAGVYTYAGQNIITTKTVPLTIPRQFASVLIDGVSVDDKWISLGLRRRDEEATDVLTLELADNSLHSSFNFNKLPTTPNIQVVTVNAIPKVDGSTSSTTTITSISSDFVAQGVTINDCVKVISSTVAADIGVWKITNIAATVLTTNHTFGSAAFITFIILTNQGKFFGEKPDVLEDVNKVVIPSIWGRNEIAKLTDPFALKVTRSYLDKTSMQTIIKALVDEAGMDPTKVTFDIPDYTIPGGLLRVVDQTPMQIIINLATKTNGYVRSDKLGNLHIKKKFFHFTGVTAVKALADDDLRGEMQESLDFPEFGNRILIRSSIPSTGQAVQVQIRPQTRCLRANAFSRMEVLGIVRDDEGKAVPDGVIVDFTIDNPALAFFIIPSRPTGQRSIVNESRRASSLTSVSTDLPIVNVLGVFLETDTQKTNNFFTGGSFGGSRITLGSDLPFTDSVVIIDYTAGGIAVATLKSNSGAPEADTKIHAAVGKVRATASFCISNRRNGSISMSAVPSEHNICVLADRTSNISARVVVDGLPAQGTMIRWTVAGIGSVSPVFSVVRNNAITEIGKAKNVFTVGTKHQIVSVSGVFLQVTGRAGTNYFSLSQDRTPRFQSNEITLGTDLPTLDATLIVDYVAAAIAETVYTAPEQVGGATVTATLNTGEEQGLTANINISVVNRCGAFIGSSVPSGGDQDCSKSVASARACANQPTQATRVECICLLEGQAGGCPSPADCKDFCAELYNKHGLNPLDCETVVTPAELSALQVAYSVIIPPGQERAYKDCDVECEGDPDCVAICVLTHRETTIERCEQTCEDHGVQISPEEATIDCDDAEPSVSFSASGNGPFVWSTTKGGITTSGVNNESATLKAPPTKTVAGIAFARHWMSCNTGWDGAKCIGFMTRHAQSFGCEDETESSCQADGAPSNTNCGNVPAGGTNGCGFVFEICANGDICGSSFCAACTALGGSVKQLCDRRSDAMINAGCAPCGLTFGLNDAVVTVRDALGNAAMATVEIA